MEGCEVTRVDSKLKVRGSRANKINHRLRQVNIYPESWSNSEKGKTLLVLG